MLHLTARTPLTCSPSRLQGQHEALTKGKAAFLAVCKGYNGDTVELHSQLQAKARELFPQEVTDLEEMLQQEEAANPTGDIIHVEGA